MITQQEEASETFEVLAGGSGHWSGSQPGLWKTDGGQDRAQTGVVLSDLYRPEVIMYHGIVLC